jgi:SnoaL-like domain
VTGGSIQARLARGYDPAELRRIKRLWVRHSIAEDRRDIDGLIATLAPGCVYEIVVTGQRWEGHDGARRFYQELFAAFPDNTFALSEIVVGPQGVFEAATLTGTNQGPWAGVPRPGWRWRWRSSSSSRGTRSRSGSPGSGSGSTGAASQADGRPSCWPYDWRT